MMTIKHYEAIALTLRDLEPTAEDESWSQWATMVTALADTLVDLDGFVDDRRFDRERFLIAAGLPTQDRGES